MGAPSYYPTNYLKKKRKCLAFVPKGAHIVDMTHEIETGSFDVSPIIGRRLSADLMEDIRTSVTRAWKRDGIVNVPALAETVRVRHEAENVALEDLEAQVMSAAIKVSAVITFNSNWYVQR